jgi:hypothetical protein
METVNVAPLTGTYAAVTSINPKILVPLVGVAIIAFPTLGMPIPTEPVDPELERVIANDPTYPSIPEVAKTPLALNTPLSPTVGTGVPSNKCRTKLAFVSKALLVLILALSILTASPAFLDTVVNVRGVTDPAVTLLATRSPAA